MNSFKCICILDVSKMLMGGKVLLKFLKFLKILFFIRNQQNVISAVDGCVLKVSVL